MSSLDGGLPSLISMTEPETDPGAFVRGRHADVLQHQFLHTQEVMRCFRVLKKKGFSDARKVGWGNGRWAIVRECDKQFVLFTSCYRETVDQGG